MQVCEHHGLPMAKRALFKEMTLVDFLCKPVSMFYGIMTTAFRSFLESSPRQLMYVSTILCIFTKCFERVVDTLRK